MSFKLSLKWFGALTLLMGAFVVLWATVIVRFVH